MLSKQDRKETVHSCSENAHFHDPGSGDDGGHRSLTPVAMVGRGSDVMLEMAALTDVELVERLAAFSGRKHVSFASKFAHFFIDMERFPIYDSFAVKMIAYHLGQAGQVRDDAHPYKAFVENLSRLKDRAHLSCTSRELGRYLWLVGLYRAWLKNSATPINVEVVELFRTLSAEKPSELAKLLSGDAT